MLHNDENIFPGIQTAISLIFFFPNSMLLAVRKITITNPTSTKLSPYLCIFHHLHSTLSLKPSLNHTQPQPQPLSSTQLKTVIFSHYHHGKFSNLLQNVVASPSVLLTASHTISTRSSELTLDSVLARLDLYQLAHELAHNLFDPLSCCAQLWAPQRQGESLVLPDLKLKVVIEALRMVLEVVYDGKFATFVYGARPGLGRHTAVRYLKNTVENPSWWFTVSFKRAFFDSKNVHRLCSIIEERIDDGLLICLIEKLFECEVVKIELGGFYLGRGLPQECGLCAILMNIYLNGFDKKLQKIRLRMNEENPKVNNVSNVVVVKPVKMYVVRYLDEILVITSGSKVLAMNLLNWVVKYLEDEFELKVDRMGTSIHSAVSEKIDFLGMELQAVPPSTLRSPLSEKAVRARKKYLRQKQVRAFELKNAREKNKRKLGMKIFSHVYKKIKQSNGFKFDYQIENEVIEIFGTWENEVMQEFFESLEERRNWYQELTCGDFLSLKRIRDQLPRELVDAYDKFQEEVDRHLNPMTIRKALEEEERKAQEEEEKKYSERTVADLTKLCMKVSAPIQLVRRAIRLVGFTNNMGRPRPISLLCALEDADVIKWYAGVGRRWLEFFSCCRNIEMIKTVVTYHLRFSCLLTLAEKHESTKHEAIRHYSKDLKISDLDGNEEVYFPTEREIKRMGDSHLSDPKPVDGVLTLALIRLAYGEPSHTCVVHFCDRKDTVTYRVCLLQHRLSIDPMDQNKWVPGMSAIHESLDRKCFPLCAAHISDFYMGRISLQDIDCTSFVDAD